MSRYQQLNECEPFEKVDSEYWSDDELEQYYVDALYDNEDGISELNFDVE